MEDVAMNGDQDEGNIDYNCETMPVFCHDVKNQYEGNNQSDIMRDNYDEHMIEEGRHDYILKHLKIFLIMKRKIL